MHVQQTSPKPSNPQRFCTSRFLATRQHTRLSPRGFMRMCRADGFSVQFEHLVSHGGWRGWTSCKHRPEEPVSCFLLNVQTQAPDTTAANVEEEASCVRRATDSKESFNDPAPAAESSPWRQASLPFIFVDTHCKFTGGFVRLHRWVFGTHVRPTPMISIKLPGSRIP